jgi:hypothetical protein
MLQERSVSRAALVLAACLLWASPAAADVAIGDACTSSTAQSAQAGLGGNNVVCVSSLWQYPAYQFGSTAASCNSTNAGIVQWTGSVFQGCNGSNWGSLTIGFGLALSALTAATTGNSIDSTNNVQTWAWGTLSTETAMTLTTSSITTGTLLNLSGTATAANAGTVLMVTTSEAGASYAIQAINGGAANTGYAGYFSNTATGAGYGVYATNATTGAGFGVYGAATGASNSGYGVYGSNASTSGYAIYASGALLATGTATAASFIPSGSTAPTNGMYLPAANTVAVATNGIETQQWNTTASGVNYMTVASGATGAAPTISNAGSDTNGAGLGLGITAKTATAVNTAGGAITLTGGAGQFGASGSVATFAGGSGAGQENGGIITLSGGAGGTAAGGVVTIIGGQSATATGGITTLQGGLKNSTISNVNIQSGNSGGNVGIGTTAATAVLHIAPVTGIAAATPALRVTGAVNTTNNTANTEVPDVDLVLNRVEKWATGSTIGTQRAVKIAAPTYTFAAASTLTDSASLGITGGPVGGTNATLTNTHALQISAGAVNGTTTPANSYGLTVNAQTGATTNYAAQFIGGSYGVYVTNNTTGTSYGVYTTMTAANTGYAGYFNNAGTGTSYALYATDATTGAGYGVYSSVTGAANTGYAGYFTNTDTGAANYTLYASNSSASGYAIYCNATNTNGCGGNQNWFNSSDIRLKDRIENLPAVRGLDGVMKLRPVTYHWKDSKMDQRRMIGFVAQEVEPLYPEAVGVGPDGMKSLAYSELVVPLIKAVQEQQAEIEKQDAELAQLRQEIAAQKERHPKN